MNRLEVDFIRAGVELDKKLKEANVSDVVTGFKLLFIFELFVFGVGQDIFDQINDLLPAEGLLGFRKGVDFVTASHVNSLVTTEVNIRGLSILGSC